MVVRETRVLMEIVRIFIGLEPRMWIGEVVLRYTIEKYGLGLPKRIIFGSLT